MVLTSLYSTLANALGWRILYCITRQLRQTLLPNYWKIFRIIFLLRNWHQALQWGALQQIKERKHQEKYDKENIQEFRWFQMWTWLFEASDKFCWKYAQATGCISLNDQFPTIKDDIDDVRDQAKLSAVRKVNTEHRNPSTVINKANSTERLVAITI